MKKIFIWVILFCAVFLGGAIVYQKYLDYSRMCTDVPMSAKNHITGEIKQFGSSCVPFWYGEPFLPKNPLQPDEVRVIPNDAANPSIKTREVPNIKEIMKSESGVMTVNFAGDVTFKQAKEVFRVVGVGDVDRSFRSTEEDNYTSWLTNAWITISDKTLDAQTATKAIQKFFTGKAEVYSVETMKTGEYVLRLEPERRGYYLEIYFADGIDKNRAQSIFDSVGNEKIPDVNRNFSDVTTIRFNQSRKNINIGVGSEEQVKKICESTFVSSCGPLPLLM